MSNRATIIDLKGAFLSKPPPTDQLTSKPSAQSHGPIKLSKRPRANGVLPSIPQSSSKGDALRASPQIKHEDPWKRYVKKFKIEIGEFLQVVVEVKQPNRLAIIKMINGPETEKQIHMLAMFDHPHLSLPKEMYTLGGTTSALFAYVPVSLAQVINSHVYPESAELALIMQQILNGTAYLHEKGYVHGRLDEPKVLLQGDGLVKIDGIEGCRKSSSQDQDVRAIGRIMVMLMQKHASEGECKLSQKREEQWGGKGSLSVNFLSLLSTGEACESLRKHKFVQQTRPYEDLRCMYELVVLTSTRHFEV